MENKKTRLGFFILILIVAVFLLLKITAEKKEEPLEIEKIDAPIGEVVIRGKVVTLEKREIRNEKTILIFSMTDFTDTIVLKMF